MEQEGWADFPTNEIKPIEGHPRGWTEVEDSFVEEIRASGGRPYISPIVRVEEGRVEVIDGLRRITAMKELGFNTVRCFVVKCSQEEALRASIVLNDEYKPLTEGQKQAAISKLLTGERKKSQTKPSEERDDVTKPDKISDILANLPGVGQSTINRVENEFGTIAKLQQSSVNQITSIPGVGRSKAQKIKKHIEQ